jgi:hypothetical protein
MWHEPMVVTHVIRMSQLPTNPILVRSDEGKLLLTGVYQQDQPSMPLRTRTVSISNAYP